MIVGTIGIVSLAALGVFYGWAMYEHGEELPKAMIISAGAEEHIERSRQVEAMGATTVTLMNNSRADPLAAIDATSCRS